MSKLFLGLTVLGLLLMPLPAQETPKAEVFGGYQFTRLSAGGEGGNLNGWNASVTGNVNRWFGVAGDFSGSYISESIGDISGSANLYTYTFGPVISLNREGTVNPFVHALFGGARLGGEITGVGSGSTSGVAVIAGGGADAKLSPRLGVRLFQADYVYCRFSGFGFNKNFRISTGLVFRF